MLSTLPSVREDLEKFCKPIEGIENHLVRVFTDFAFYLRKQRGLVYEGRRGFLWLGWAILKVEVIEDHHVVDNLGGLKYKSRGVISVEIALHIEVLLPQDDALREKIERRTLCDLGNR